jgi:hypothetical protein
MKYVIILIVSIENVIENTFIFFLSLDQSFPNNIFIIKFKRMGPQAKINSGEKDTKKFLFIKKTPPTEPEGIPLAKN